MSCGQGHLLLEQFSEMRFGVADVMECDKTVSQIEKQVKDIQENYNALDAVLNLVFAEVWPTSRIDILVGYSGAPTSNRTATYMVLDDHFLVRPYISRSRGAACFPIMLIIGSPDWLNVEEEGGFKGRCSALRFRTPPPEKVAEQIFAVNAG